MKPNKSMIRFCNSLGGVNQVTVRPQLSVPTIKLTPSKAFSIASVRSIPRISISLLIIALSLLAQGHFEKSALK